MLHTSCLTRITALSVLGVIHAALSHGHNDHGEVTANMASLNKSASYASTNSTGAPPQSYSAYPQHGSLMLAHIGLMIIAWFFILPIGVVLNVARSRLALLIQMSFLGLHSFALILGKIYSSNTPDLYNNNFHNEIGWVVTGVVVAQCAMGVVKLVAAIENPEAREEEQAALLHISSEALNQADGTHAYRHSNDSGHYTASESSRSQSVSSIMDQDEQKQHLMLRKPAEQYTGIEASCTGKLGSPRSIALQRIASLVSVKMSRRTIKVIDAVNTIVDSTSLLLGFVAILSGAVVYGGVFRGKNVFNGLAHSVKGGIFFWYGLLTLGRWIGCFADIGWAWNVKPPVGVVSPRKARTPSAEFVESFVIFLYGASNVWLEHLAAWGSAWSPQDFEHVSISIMFFGGGLCGMLVESRKIRELLNTTIVNSSAAHGPQYGEMISPPKTYAFSMNPFPGLIILLLGLMMSSHHQTSVVSTMIHKQWGTLFVGFALARAVTYIMIYISPPMSYLPSRPPSELVSSFCLISGGIIFIASNKDTVAALENHGIHAMFPFTVTMGFTAFLMAWVIIALAVKGWAIRRTQRMTF